MRSKNGRNRSKKENEGNMTSNTIIYIAIVIAIGIGSIIIYQRLRKLSDQIKKGADQSEEDREAVKKVDEALKNRCVDPLKRWLDAYEKQWFKNRLAFYKRRFKIALIDNREVEHPKEETVFTIIGNELDNDNIKHLLKQYSKQFLDLDADDSKRVNDAFDCIKDYHKYKAWWEAINEIKAQLDEVSLSEELKKSLDHEYNANKKSFEEARGKFLI